MARLLASVLGFIFLSAVALAAEPKPAALPKFGCTTIAEIKPFRPEKEEHWEAWGSYTIAAVGPMRLSQSQITFDSGETLKLRYLGDWQPDPDVFSRKERECYAVYAIEPPTRGELIHGNHLCGPDDDAAAADIFLIATERGILGARAISIIPMSVGTTFDRAGVGEHYCNSMDYFQP